MPREAWQRIPSNIMEPWLREKCDQNALIDIRYGWRVQEILEHRDSVDVTAFVTEFNQSRSLRCTFAVGCDGAWSPIRKSLGIEVEGGPMYVEQIHLHGSFAAILTDVTC
jgi:FAD-dependent monooxygenase